MTQKKYLFLDIDGVLNSHRTSVVNNGATGHGGLAEPAQYLDPIAIRMLNRLVEHGVDIILSSTWRLGLKDTKDLVDFSEVYNFAGSPDQSKLLYWLWTAKQEFIQTLPLLIHEP